MATGGVESYWPRPHVLSVSISQQGIPVPRFQRPYLCCAVLLLSVCGTHLLVDGHLMHIDTEGQHREFRRGLQCVD
jgi:hypothetical protein